MNAPHPPSTPSRIPITIGLMSVGMILLEVAAWFIFDNEITKLIAIAGLLVFQFALGLASIIIGALHQGPFRRPRGPIVLGAAAMLSAVATAGTFLFAVLGSGFMAAGMGGAWGRPLRVRGKQLHPELKEGSDWTEGARPSPAGLDEPTRFALEALWLHDAQKEHASVPAFARIGWLLAAVGGPADLMAWSHRAAIEEIEHTKACFALAAGYAGRSFTVEPMPELLVGGLDVKGNALALLAKESLGDGCQLEDFNADVAAACAEICKEPVTRSVLERIAREERSHADFSWALLEWLVAHHRAEVEPAIHAALEALDGYPRPTAVSHDKAALVRRADATALRAHGRLPDERWAEIWDTRLVETRARVARLLRTLTTAGSLREAA